MSRRAAWAARLAPAFLVMGGALLAWALLPTAPNYDTATHLIWARELLDGGSPAVDAPASPTPHPLWLLAALIASGTGGGASLLQLVALLAYGVVIVAVWRLARSLAGPVAAGAAALFTASSFALLLSAYKAYADLPFLALVLGGLLAEQQRRARGGHRWTMPALLVLAGLLRPEAWAFGLLLVALRALQGEDRRAMLAPAVVIATAPALWVLFDLLLTGDPLHSLTGTQALAEELGRRTGALAGPVELVRQLADLLRPPVFLAGLFGVGGAIWLAGWRPLLPLLAPLLAGALGFLALGVLGLPLLQRYLLLPGMLLAIFAGVGVAILVEAGHRRCAAHPPRPGNGRCAGAHGPGTATRRWRAAPARRPGHRRLPGAEGRFVCRAWPRCAARGAVAASGDAGGAVGGGAAPARPGLRPNHAAHLSARARAAAAR